MQCLPRMTSLRLALAAALLPALTACTATVPLELSEQVALQSPGGAFSRTQEVDLTTTTAVWSRRGDIDAISIDEVTATVRSIGAGHQAARVSLSLAFRAAGAPADGSQDVAAGTLADLPLTVGGAVTLPGSPALEAFLMEVLHGSGHFSVVASGSLDGAANAVLELSLKGSAAYKVVGG